MCNNGAGQHSACKARDDAYDAVTGDGRSPRWTSCSVICDCTSGLLGKVEGVTSPDTMKEISDPRGCVCGVLPAQGPA